MISRRFLFLTFSKNLSNSTTHVSQSNANNSDEKQVLIFIVILILIK